MNRVRFIQLYGFKSLSPDYSCGDIHMQLLCPYCHSENVQRLIQTQGYQSSSSNVLGSSATFATIGASLTKSLAGQLPIPISPLIGGIAGAVVGGLFGSIFDAPSSQARPHAYSNAFFCHDCQQSFH